MGKSIKKILKGIETKNGKNKECEGEVEKSQVKDRPKVRSIWSKWSSLFHRMSSSRIRSTKNSTPQLLQQPQIPQILMNNSPKDMELWNHEESLDVNSQMLNIPIEPGRQVSTIILSPTKTGFKAVIAHYDVNASVRHSLTKDFKTVSEQIENRRTLTLVFDMNQRTFEEIGVGKSECRVHEEEPDLEREDSRNISASALYVRDDADELVESAAFLQAQLSLDNMELKESSLFISEEKSINVERRHVSCKSMEKSRVAFKTISEPMCKEKEKMRKEMLIQQNIQEMLNQFIFLERDDSLMNYPRVCQEMPMNVEELREEKDEAEEVEREAEQEEEKENRDEKDVKKWSATDPFLPGDFSVFNTNSARNVASNILVNIKPFKEYIGSYPKIDVKMEKSVPKKVEITTKNVEKYPFRPPQNVLSAGPRKKFEDRGNKHGVKFQKTNTKSRLSLCIKCGTEERGDEAKKLKRETSIHFGKNVYKSSDHSSVTTHTGKSRSSVAITSSVREDIPCTLCSVWKRYKKKSSFTSITHVGDSFEDILKEFESYDHEMIFRQNISQFRTKISAKSPSIEFKTSHSSLSFAEVIELEEGKISQVTNHKAILEDSKIDDMQRVTVRLIEFVRKNKEKTVELQRIRTAMEQLYCEKIPLEPTAKISRFENSSLIFTFRESNKMIRVMAQKIEQNMLRSFTNANEVIISEANITVIFPAYINWAKVSNLGIPRRHSENRLDEFKRSFTNYKRPGQIPDVINHLLANKVDDLRNELITSLNETRMIYNCESYRSVRIANVTQEEENKTVSGSSSKRLKSCAVYSGEDAKEDGEQHSSTCVEEHTETRIKEILGKELTETQDEKYSTECNTEHLGMPVEQGIEQNAVNLKEENLKEQSEVQTEEFLKPQVFSGSSISERPSSSSSTSKQSERNLEDLYKMEGFKSVQEKSTETTFVEEEAKKNLELAEAPSEVQNMDVGLKKLLTFKATSDYSVHSCLMFFIPYVQQIQTAIEILNNIAYDFPILKEEEERVDKDCIQIMRSYTLLSDKKKYLMDRGVESVIAEKCMEKNVVNGIETSKTSKKEITTIESSKSGNHLLLTSKRILTNDRRKKTEIVGGEAGAESSSKILQGNNESVLLRKNLPEESEDVNGIRFLYCNRTDGNGTCESSVASNYSYGLDKVRESSSSVIAINELGESMRVSTDVRLNDTEEDIQGYCQQTATSSENTNKVDNSLQEIDVGIGKLANKAVKCEIVALSQKAKDSIISNRESGRVGLNTKITKKPSSLAGESKISVTKRDSVKVKVTEEKLIINKEELSNVILPQNIRSPSVKVIKKVGKGIVSQRIVPKSSGGGREMIIRQEEDKVLKKKENENAKRMSVVITLSKRKKESERSSSAPGKYHTNCQNSRGIIKLTKISSSVPGNRKS